MRSDRFKLEHCYAIGLKDGRCPVGYVTLIGSNYIDLRLFGELGVPIDEYVTIQMNEIGDVLEARWMTHEEQRRYGFTEVNDTTAHLEELFSFKTSWAIQHGI